MPSRPKAEGKDDAPPEGALPAKPLKVVKAVTKVPEGTDSKELPSNAEDHAPMHRLGQRL